MRTRSCAYEREMDTKALEPSRDPLCVESELVAHIGEVDARRLYARKASSSMFVYCTEVLHLSEHEAYLRIAVARASRRHPVLLDMLGDGRLHLSGIAKLAPWLTEANRETLLARAAYKSQTRPLAAGGQDFTQAGLCADDAQATSATGANAPMWTHLFATRVNS